jgi:DNA-binding LacI/PurR family transcriptional regulator
MDPSLIREQRAEQLAKGGRKKAQILAEFIKQDIEAGIFKRDEKLPSYDDLGLAFSINRLTVRKAIKVLEEQNVVHSISAKGTYAGPGPKPQRPKELQNSIGLYSELVNFDNMGYHHLELISALSKELMEEQFQMNFIHQTLNEDLNIDDLKRYAGVMAIGPLSPESAKAFLDLDAFVHIDPQVESKSVCVSADYFQGGQLAAEHLLEKGHRNIALIHGNQACCEEIFQGFQKACSNTKTEIHSYQGDYTAPSAQECVENVLKEQAHATAIFCMNDEMAAGAIQCLSKHGYQIPKDFSVVGFDNSAVATLLDPPLQTIGVPTGHMAQAAVESLEKQIKPSGKYIASATILTSMVQRESTGDPRK